MSAPSQPTNVRFFVLASMCMLAFITYLDRICIMRVQADIARDLALDTLEPEDLNRLADGATNDYKDILKKPDLRKLETKNQLFDRQARYEMAEARVKSERQNSNLGWVFGAFLLGYLLFEIPGGWLGDVWGTRLVIFRIVVWWSLFTALTGSADGLARMFTQSPSVTLLLATLVVIRFFFGAGEAGAYPNISRVLGRWFPDKHRAKAQGAIWMASRLGGASAPVVIGALMGYLGGWRQAFWALGAVGVVWALFHLLWYRDRPEDMLGVNAAEMDLIRGPAAASGSIYDDHSMVGVPWGKILLSPRCWAYYLAGASISFSWYVYVTFLPSFLKDEFEVSYEQTEIMTGLPLLAGAVTCFLGGGLSDWLVQKTGSRRWGRSGVGMAGYGLAGLTTLGVAFLNRENASVWGVIALICLTTAIQDLALAAIWATAADIGQRYTGTVAGCLNTIGGIGGFLSPYMAPWLYKNWGWQGVFLCYAASYFFGALMWLFIDASKPVTQGHDKSVGDV